jgi:uncharacterized protein YlxW (UPF0749 family)
MTPNEDERPTGTRWTGPDFLLQLFQDPLDPSYADAARANAERRAASAPPPAAWRRHATLALRVVTLVATGFLLAVAYRQAVAAEPERSQAQAGLVEEVRAAQTRTDDLQRRADTLRDEVTRLQETALGGRTEELRQIRDLAAATGLAKVTGDGVVITLSDAPAQIDPKTGRPADAGERVIDRDLQSAVNALWSAGAEAIALDGQRLTATSTIRAAGDAILVDFRPVTSPYEIAAIGPADLGRRFGASSAAADMRGLAAQYGIGFSVRDQANLTLPASATDVPLQYATPISPGSPSAPTPTKPR